MEHQQRDRKGKQTSQSTTDDKRAHEQSNDDKPNKRLQEGHDDNDDDDIKPEKKRKTHRGKSKKFYRHMTTNAEDEHDEQAHDVDPEPLADIALEGFLHDGELLVRDKHSNRVYLAERDEDTNERILIGKWDPETNQLRRFTKTIKSKWESDVTIHQETSSTKREKTQPVPQNVARPIPTVLNFPTPEDDDHCETSILAYKDVLPILKILSDIKGKPLNTEFAIYDPFYCTGKIKVLFKELGVENVINENVDAYATDHVPVFDVLLTNPPYSGHHIDRLLERVTSSPEPALLLLPSYVSWKNEQLLTDAGVFYVLPSTGARYTYHKPSGLKSGQVGRTAPFPSFWYVFCKEHKRVVLAELRKKRIHVVTSRFKLPRKQLDVKDPLYATAEASHHKESFPPRFHKWRGGGRGGRR